MRVSVLVACHSVWLCCRIRRQCSPPMKRRAHAVVSFSGIFTGVLRLRVLRPLAPTHGS
jgi:hypothetical protein